MAVDQVNNTTAATSDSCADFSTAFVRLLFDAHDTFARCEDATGVFAFASLAAIAFASFVIIDVMVALVRKYGFAADGAGSMGIDSEGAASSWGFVGKSAFVIIFGMIAAWIVAFFAAVVDFLQTAPHTAVATGVLWQVTYAQLLNRFGATVKDPDQERRDPAELEEPVDEEAEIQEATEEVAE